MNLQKPSFKEFKAIKTNHQTQGTSVTFYVLINSNNCLPLLPSSKLSRVSFLSLRQELLVNAPSFDDD